MIEVKVLLGALFIPLLIAAGAIMAALSERGDDKSSSSTNKTYESYERIRVYPSQRRAVRYYNGKEEYEY